MGSGEYGLMTQESNRCVFTVEERSRRRNEKATEEENKFSEDTEGKGCSQSRVLLVTDHEDLRT